jgi:hypothetical protein
MTNNVFGDEWRECLREHFKYVVQHDTRTTLESLRVALLQGDPPVFTEDELRDLYIEATLRAEDLPDDFVPEVLLESYEQLQAAAPDLPENPAHPLECQCPACVELNRVPHDADGQPLDADALAELDEEQRHTGQDDPDTPQQLSLF